MDQEITKRLDDLETEQRITNSRLFKIEQVMVENFPEHFAGEADTLPDPALKPILLPTDHTLIYGEANGPG